MEVTEYLQIIDEREKPQGRLDRYYGIINALRNIRAEDVEAVADWWYEKDIGLFSRLIGEEIYKPILRRYARGVSRGRETPKEIALIARYNFAWLQYLTEPIEIGSNNLDYYCSQEGFEWRVEGALENPTFDLQIMLAGRHVATFRATNPFKRTAALMACQADIALIARPFYDGIDFHLLNYTMYRRYADLMPTDWQNRPKSSTSLRRDDVEMTKRWTSWTDAFENFHKNRAAKYNEICALGDGYDDEKLMQMHDNNSSEDYYQDIISFSKFEIRLFDYPAEDVVFLVELCRNYTYELLLWERYGYDRSKKHLIVGGRWLGSLAPELVRHPLICAIADIGHTSVEVPEYDRNEKLDELRSLVRRAN